MANHIVKSTSRKQPSPERPPKPYPKFPLYPHASGFWAKKVRGKLHYFGRWGQIRDKEMVRLEGDGWVKALELFKAQKEDLEAGRKPREVSEQGELTVKELCNKFLNSKLKKLEMAKLSPRSFAELKHTALRITAQFGKSRIVSDLAGDDFEDLLVSITKTCGVVRQGNEITRVRSIFKYAVDNRLIDRPVNFGSEFKKPDRREMRLHRASQAKKLFEAREIRKLYKASDDVFKAAILMGINCGAGNTDVANLTFAHLDLDKGWLTYPRGKTGIQRRIPLWPETVAALKTAIESRRKPKELVDAEIVLINSRRERLVRITEKSRTDGVAVGFGKLLRKLEINGRKGLGFYSLRHTFATIGLGTGDRDAVKAIMGHVESDVLSLYDETGPSDERLLAVTHHVRDWYLAGKKGGV